MVLTHIIHAFTVVFQDSSSIVDSSFIQSVVLALSKCLDDAEVCLAAAPLHSLSLLLLKVSLLPEVYEDAVVLMVAEINILLEQQIMRSSFNQVRSASKLIYSLIVITMVGSHSLVE